VTLAENSVLVQGAGIIAGTFILEDATSIATAMAVQDHHLSLTVGLVSLFIGIVVGDLGLYGLGMLAARVQDSAAWARRLVPPERRIQGRDWVDNRLIRLVVTARFLPGVRLPAYTTCGFLGANFPRFAFAAIGATLAWTGFLFTISLRIGALLIEHLGAYRWAGALGFIVAVMIVMRLVALFQPAAPAAPDAQPKAPL
jgi:membrane protein DedA with SNARE-associated domain